MSVSSRSCYPDPNGLLNILMEVSYLQLVASYILPSILLFRLSYIDQELMIEKEHATCIVYWVPSQSKLIT